MNLLAYQRTGSTQPYCFNQLVDADINYVDDQENTIINEQISIKTIIFPKHFENTTTYSLRSKLDNTSKMLVRCNGHKINQVNIHNPSNILISQTEIWPCIIIQSTLFSYRKMCQNLQIYQGKKVCTEIYSYKTAKLKRRQKKIDLSKKRRHITMFSTNKMSDSTSKLNFSTSGKIIKHSIHHIQKPNKVGVHL